MQRLERSAELYIDSFMTSKGMLLTPVSRLFDCLEYHRKLILS